LEEKNNLQLQLDSQEFTPLEIQSMIHKKMIFEESIDNLNIQKEKIQKDLWDIGNIYLF
jgi:hypothetical protein